MVFIILKNTCVWLKSNIQTISTFFVFENKVVKDIIVHHLFTDYSPLIFVLSYFNEIDLNKQNLIKIIYSISSLENGSNCFKKDIVATLSLKKIKEQKTYNPLIIILKE
jgi:hypothetical protein